MDTKAQKAEGSCQTSPGAGGARFLSPVPTWSQGRNHRAGVQRTGTRGPAASGVEGTALGCLLIPPQTGPQVSVSRTNRHGLRLPEGPGLPRGLGPPAGPSRAPTATRPPCSPAGLGVHGKWSTGQLTGLGQEAQPRLWGSGEQTGPPGLPTLPAGLEPGIMEKWSLNPKPQGPSAVHPSVTHVPRLPGFGQPVRQGNWGGASACPATRHAAIRKAARLRRAGETRGACGLGTRGASVWVRRAGAAGECPAPSCRTPAGPGSRPARRGPGGPCSAHGCLCGPHSRGRAQTGKQEGRVRRGSC